MTDFVTDELREEKTNSAKVRSTVAGRWRSGRLWLLRLLGQALADQTPQAVLWWPIGIAVGIGLFFSLPNDPPVWVGPAVFTTTLLFRLVILANPLTRFVLIALMLASAGFSAAQFRTSQVSAPILTSEIGPAMVGGSVVMVEPLGRANRVTLDQLSISGLESELTPRKVRVRLPVNHGDPRVGQRIQVRAVIRPPGRPVAPGAFDFQRYSFFRQLGGVGFAVGTWELLEDVGGSDKSWSDQVSLLRATVGDRFSIALPDESGTIARALVTGERSAVPEPLQEAYRQAGLAHMLAISGLHMSLLTGLVFVIVRYGLASVLPIAERYDTKKIAALVSLGAATFYLLLSGMNVPAQRAFIMISVVLFAVLIDRTAISLRTLAWAALAVLLLQPDSLMGASFQLSFAAVVALITVYEKVHIRSTLWDSRGHFKPVRAIVLYCAVVLVTDLIATSATVPFTAYHFHRVPSYSLLANLLAAPIMGLWIMPFGLFALLLMPLGLEGLALPVMGAGIDLVNTIARFVSELPGSTLHTPPAEMWALVCTSLGAIFICLWRGWGRIAGLVPLTIGLLQPWFASPPDVLVNETAEVYAVKGADGRLVLSPGRREGFTRDVWIERWGESTESWTEAKGLNCDTEGCIHHMDGARAGLAFTDEAVSEDCGRVDIIIAKVPSWRLCRSGMRIDRFDVWRHGAHAVWVTQSGPRVERVSDFTGRRIWNQPTWR